MRRTTLIYVLVLLIATSAIAAFAQNRKGNAQKMQPAGCLANCQKVLGLSQDQVTQMSRIRTTFADDTAALRTDLQARMKEIAGLWTSEDPDLQLIKDRAADADQVRAQIRDQAIDARCAILKVLTPAQRAKCIQRCQNGDCGCGMGGGLGMGMGLNLCGMGAGNGSGNCPMGTGMGKGRGGAGMGMGKGCGMGGNCPMQK